MCLRCGWRHCRIEPMRAAGVRNKLDGIGHPSLNAWPMCELLFGHRANTQARYHADGAELFNLIAAPAGRHRAVSQAIQKDSAGCGAH